MADQPPVPPSIDPTGVPDPPDSTPYGTPTIKVDATDYQDPPRPNPNDFWAAQAAEDVYYTAYWFMIDHHVPRIFAWALGGAVGLAVGILAYVIAAGFWTITKIGLPFAQFVIGAMSEARKQLDPGLPNLAADILGELTGADIKAENFPTGKGFQGHLGRVIAIGNELHTLLEGEFSPDGTVSPDQGATAAKAFTGFNINFGIGTAIMSLLGEIETLGHVEQFRELGVEVARNLGLGRLSRQALQPLIHTCVALPYSWHLNSKYRPTRLNETQLIHAFFRGEIDDLTMTQELALLGYADDKQKHAVADLRKQLDERQISRLWFSGQMDEAEATRRIKALGYADDVVAFATTAERPTLEKAEITALYAHNAIDQATALGHLTKLGYDATTADLVLKAHTFTHTHTPVLHFGELRRLMQENVIDVLEFGDRLRAQGYSDDDVNLLTLDALHPVKSKEKMLPLAEIKAAYKAGLLNGAQAISDLQNLGYSKTDATIIVGTFATAKKATPTTPTTPAGG